MGTPASTRWPPRALAIHGTDPNQEATKDDERPRKRRKVGIAETILSTAVSVAIVSTAVGYTVYRL
jgi:hypothetical protein